MSGVQQVMGMTRAPANVGGMWIAKAEVETRIATVTPPLRIQAGQYLAALYLPDGNGGGRWQLARYSKRGALKETRDL